MWQIRRESAAIFGKAVNAGLESWAAELEAPCRPAQSVAANSILGAVWHCI
jgi:hypothetical protein